MEHPGNSEISPLDHLKTVTTDPVVEHVFNTARDYEHMLNTSDDITAEDLTYVAQELTEMWPYLGHELNVSGMVSFRSEETEEITTEYYDDTPMISNGICFNVETIMHDDEVIGTKYKAGLHLIRFNESANEGRKGVGLLNDVAVDYPFNSSEMIINRLRYFYPDVIEQLDTIVLNCNTEEEAVMRLEEFSLDLHGSDEENGQLVGDLQQYLVPVLEFDKELPYSVTICGNFYAETDNGIRTAVEEGTFSTLAQIVRVRFFQHESSLEEEKPQLKSYIEAYLFSSDKSDAPAHVYIPSTSIQDVVSVRRNTYANHQ